MMTVQTIRRVVVMIALTGLAACGPGTASREEPVDASVLEAELMDADRAFNAATSESGVEGWASFFAEDAAMVQSGVGEIRGKEAIFATMAPYFATGARLSWEPLRAEVSGDGTLGYTIGEYRSETVGADGESLSGRGLYVSVWRREGDGSWRVVMDLGNPVDVPTEEG